jgi:hypothetical protein
MCRWLSRLLALFEEFVMQEKKSMLLALFEEFAEHEKEPLSV